MDPALTLAIFEKLTGFPFDNSQRPVLDPTTLLPTNRHKSFGMRIPVPSVNVSRGALSTDNPSALRLWGRGYQKDLYMPIVVHMEGPDAKKYEDVWPSVSFVESDILPGKDPYIYRDPIGVLSGDATITSHLTGATETGPNQGMFRKHPTPWNVVYTVRMFSRNPVEIQWMERCFLDMWDVKGAISVERADGQFRMVDYEMERVAFFDQGEGFNPKTGVGPTEDRHLSRAFTLMFETYLDNTVQGFGTQDWTGPEYTVLERIMEIQGKVDMFWEGRRNLSDFLP